jgi:type II secretion system protein N
MAPAAKEINKKWLGYILYVVLVTLALLYYLFPAEAVEEAVGNRVNRINSALGFKAEGIRPWIPAGIRIDAGQIYVKDSSVSPVFKADSIYIGPRILQSIRGKYSFDLSGSAYKGDINGWFDSKDEDGMTFASALSFKDFDIAAYEFLAEKLQHRIIGTISGNIEYGNDSGRSSGGNGKAGLRMTDGQLQFQAPIFGISSIDLQNIHLELELHNREITIVKAEMVGSEMKASMTGSIQLQADIKLSQLNLKGALEPLAEFYKNYPEIRNLLKSMKKRVKRGQYFFAITGTLGEPRFRLL